MLAALVALLGCIFVLPAQSQCVSLNSAGTLYVQNFDSLAISGMSSALPAGWLLAESGTNANATYTAGTGSGTGGDTYSFGAASSTERALGGLQSGSLIPQFGACFINNTGAALGSLSIAYVGEQWRLGAVGRVDRLDFAYSLDASSLTTGTWTDVNTLDFTAPVTAGTAGALDGNAIANRTALSHQITGLNIPSGATFYIRWQDFNATSSDDGLAVDDFSLQASALVIQPDLSITSVSQAEGNSGTTPFTFTVNLSTPAGPAGVSFDIAAVAGTATIGTDFAANSLTGVSIPSGSSSYQFTVLVNGDTVAEGNETFTVVVSNITGANPTGGTVTGTGTIQNDDAGVDLSIAAISLPEGNSGTTTFTFTVLLSAPAPVGGVTFDIATSSGTATSGTDFVANSLTGQVIPEGATSYLFNVLVNGDSAAEPDETFSVTVTNVSGAVVLAGTATGTIVTDDITRIHAVQGSGSTSPLSGQTVSVEGIVTMISQGPGTLLGFFIQEPDALVDADPLTSEGMFIFTNATPASVQLGDLVRVTGLVTEFGTAPNSLTEIGTPAASPVVQFVSSNNGLPAFTQVSLPVATAGDLERFEGMRVRFSQTLTVSDHFNLAQYGELGLSVNGRLMQPTNVIDPNDASPAGTTSSGSTNVSAVLAKADLNARSSIILDGSPTTFAATVPFLDPVTNTIRLGSTLNDMTGVLGQLGGTHRVYPDVAPVITHASRPSTAPDVGGNVRVASLNVLNYFNGDGVGGGFPTSRGATTAAEFLRQRAKVIQAVLGLNADVVGLLEIENDGTGPNSAIQDLVNGLNAATAPGTWALIPDPTGYSATPGGSDLIKPAIIFRPGNVAPVGDSLTSSDSAFSSGRSPVAQTFRLLSNDERFTLVVNHFKSKGSGGGGLDADQGDGQGFYNNRRKLQATALLGFMSSLTAATPRIITMGDFNAYEQEDPMDILREGGLTTIVNDDYSYLFDGQSGSLDHALGTSALMTTVSGAAHWHINADEPAFLDYNVENKATAGCSTACTLPDYFAASPFRAADHDPIVVGLQLNAAQFTVTPSAGSNGSINPSTPQAVTQGQTFPFTVTPDAGYVATVGGTCGGALVGNAYTTATITANCTVVATFSLDVTANVASHDFNDDGRSDVLWKGPAGEVELWLMDGGTVLSQHQLLGGGTGYFISQVADFNGDGRADLVWQSGDGASLLWLMDGGTVAGAADLFGGGTNWRVRHIGDFNGNGRADLVWEESVTGATSIWLMNGGSFVSGADLVGPNTGWRIGHVADFNGDGKSDLVWEHSSGAASLWLMDGTSYLGGMDLVGSGTGWRVKHVGDFNGDGRADLLWEHTSGATNLWLMNGAALLGGGVGLVGGGSGYEVKAVGDFNGDGRQDLLWQSAQGAVLVWLMNGGTVLGTADLVGANSGYEVQWVRDYNGDGRADLLWRNTVDGSTLLWFMNGTTVTSTVGLRGPTNQLPEP